MEGGLLFRHSIDHTSPGPTRRAVTLAATLAVADLATSITHASAPQAMPPNAFGQLSMAFGVLFGAAWRSQLELGFNGSSGNSSFGILRTGESLSRIQTEVYELEVSALLRYGKSEGRVIAEDFRSTLKLDWKPDADFSPFTYVTVGRDRIRKLDSKSNGAGLGQSGRSTAAPNPRTKPLSALPASSTTKTSDSKPARRSRRRAARCAGVHASSSITRSRPVRASRTSRSGNHRWTRPGTTSSRCPTPSRRCSRRACR